jgi:hypothetical protein
MSQPYDATGTTRTTSTVQGRTHAFLGLALALVALLGGGVIANAVFYRLIDTMGYQAGTAGTVLQGLPSLAMGLLGAGLGWAGSTSADDVAVPVGRAATVVGSLAVLGAVALMIAGQV